MIINGIELEDIDIFDADTSEKIEKAIQKTSNEIKFLEDKSGENLKNHELVRKICNIIFECFNEIFGKDTDKKVFGDKVNLMTCTCAYDELISSTSEMASKQQAKIDSISKKYSSNRAQRRSKK